MKTIIINASPRKNWNTAKLLHSAKKGAERAGAEIEYFDLYDMTFSGCRSCLLCKAKDNERCKCFWNDDLTPLIEKILKADNVIIGAPIYFGDASANFHALLERLLFCCYSYDGEVSYYTKKINFGIIYTMNAPSDYPLSSNNNFKLKESLLHRVLHGEVVSYASCNTLQVCDYSKYAMSAFNEQTKKAHHDKQFPIDLENAFKMGYELGE